MKLESNMFNMQPSPIDTRDFTFPHVGGGEVVGDFVVGGVEHPVYDQGRSSMCSGFALASIQEYYDNFEHRFSPAFLYGNREEGDYDGEGEYMREAMKDWHRDGVCYFEDFDTIGPVEDCIREFDELPDTVKAYAKENKIESFYRLNVKDPQGVFELMEAFDLPVSVSLPLYSSFSKAYKDGGIVPLPSDEDKYLGGHAVRFVGKKTIDGQEYYIMPNSWGTDIADNGTQYLPIDYPIWEIWLPLPYVKKEIKLKQDDNKYYVNGVELEMDTVPVNKEGRVYIPLRFVVEAIGNVFIEWYDESRTAVVYRGGGAFHFQDGRDGFFSEYSTTYYKYEDEPSREGVTINYIDSNSRMMIPVRKLCEVLGFNVSFDADTKVITISN